MNQKAIYYPYFDYLRIALAIVVMLFHDNLIDWEHTGNLAVQVFFALSGWLIGGMLLRLSRNDLPRFYFNRAVRIWVPYYISFTLLILVSLVHDRIDGKWAEFVFYKFSFVYNLFGPPQLAQYKQAMPLQGTGNHFWSVNAEEQFYLVAPLLLVLASPKFCRTLRLWIGIALVAWISHIYASIVFGVLAAIIVNVYGPIHLKQSSRYGLFGITIATAIGLFAGLDYDLLSPFFSICVVLLLAIKGTQNRVGAFVGGISYPLYLNHWIGFFIGHTLLNPFHLKDSAVQHLASFVLNLGIASGLYWWVDRRILAVRGKLFTSQRGAIVIAIAYSLTFVGILGGLIFLRHNS